MKRRTYISLMILIAFIVTGFQVAEDPVFIQKLKALIREYNASYPEEKVYLQFDKPFYKPGETIWFNAMVLNSNTHTPSSISDVLYAELIDPKGNVAARQELVIKEGTTHGDFTIAENTPGGMYRVRAFTHWMKNFGDDACFKKEIQIQRVITPRLLLKLDYEKESYGANDEVVVNVTVSNLKNEKVSGADINYSVRLSGNLFLNHTATTGKNGISRIAFRLPPGLSTADGLFQAVVSTQGVEESISRSIPIVLNQISLQFFPEGGHLVENVNTRVAFKALNEFSKGADVAGSIVDDSNTVITRFESFHMGMGAFEFKPAAGRKYFAQIDTPSGNTTRTPLPQVLSSGYVLNLKSADSVNLEWNIHSPTEQQIYLAGQVHGELVYTESITVSAGANTVRIPTEKFPAGIAAFTLFDAEGNPRCERLVFTNRDKGLHIKLTTDKTQYLPREKVQLNIETTDDSGRPLAAKLSLAVADDQIISFADDKQDNILSAMLLSSEVRGEIQEPSFYFDPAEPKAIAALDYLLMTQGWRRFTWKEIIKPTRNITFNPEKVKNISGQIVDSNREGFATEVTLIEAGNKRRVEKVKTTPDGRFVFMNIDPTVSILLLARKPSEISLQKEMPFFIALNDKDGTKLYRDTDGAPIVSPPPVEEAAEVEVVEEGGLNMGMDEDVASLSEVVVVGYSSVESKSLTGSIQRINRGGLETSFSPVTVDHLLQGRVAGVMITPQQGSAGASTNIRIRGVSSLGNGNNDPLYVIDGQVIGTSLNHNFSNGTMLGPEDIESIEILHSSQAMALFGSRASNGVINITTKSRINYGYFHTRRKNARYSSAVVRPRNFSATREFYVEPPAKNQTGKREDFRSTVYWNHTVVTDEKGRAALSFFNNDAVSAFRITAEGFSGTGLIGRKEKVYHTLLPFSLDAKLPAYLGFEDVLRLPVVVKNETSTTLSGKLILSLPDAFRVEEQPTSTVEVPPMSAKTFIYTIKPTGIEGEFPLSIKLQSENYEDQTEQTIRVQSVGFPLRLSFSAKQKDKAIRFSVHDVEQGTLRAELTAFPDVLSDLFTGAEAILHEPYGCFEQVSSSTFPNILALQFLRQSGMINPAIEKKAMGYIQDGYKRLMAYEIQGGGFEWFGRPPAHEGLTAYGLIEFMEMSKVYSGVSQDMIKRTRDWMLSRKNGKGGFEQHTGLHGFANASKEVDNAYITYALSETGATDIIKEYENAYTEVMRSKDMYRMALVANTAYNLGKLEQYTSMIRLFRKEAETEFKSMRMDHSVMRSYGNSLVIETVSLWASALMKSESPDLDLIKKSIDCILQNRTYGQFGSTQGTALALKALTEYAKIIRATSENGEIQILVNNTLTESLAYESDNRDKLIMNKFVSSLGNGEQNLRVLFNNTGQPLPYSVNVQWRTKEPPSSTNCKVKLTTTLAAETVRGNETVRLAINLKNKTTDGLPMTVAIVGIPAGLSVQPWQLKELQEKNVFDFYEIMNNNLVLYYREMGPAEIHVVNLDLKAEIPGTYTASPSSAYLYYTNEYKDWVRGTSVTIH
ncbi:MAG TPA: MG2 domain-containing protein [Ohtaekwangia sp.]